MSEQLLGNLGLWLKIAKICFNAVGVFVVCKNKLIYFMISGIEVDIDEQHDSASEKIPKTQDSAAEDKTENNATNNTNNDETENVQDKDKKNVSKVGEHENEDGKRKSDKPTAEAVCIELRFLKIGEI